MQLTRRQETFVLNLLELYRELNGPIHYSVLAERVGVSRITAYDMLRLLEEKGFVTSDYQRGKPGPGRAEVVFWPTEFARQRLAQWMEGADDSDWEEVKQRTLERILEDDLTGYADEELAQKMFAMIPPDGPASLRYCGEVMTILILRLHNEKSRRCFRMYLPDILADAEPVSAIDLNLLSGFILGLLAGENGTMQASNEELVDHVKQYQRTVLGMDADLRNQLAVHICDIFASFDTDQKSKALDTPETTQLQ